MDRGKLNDWQYKVRVLLDEGCGVLTLMMIDNRKMMLAGQH